MVVYQGGHDGEKAQREASRQMLERSMESSRREAQNLLTLRLRDQVSDEDYVTKKREIDERIAGLEAKLKAPPRSEEELRDLTTRTFRFATRAAAVFRTGDPVQQRMIFQAVQLNSTLRARKLVISAKNPFQMIAEAGASRDWCRGRELNSHEVALAGF